MSIIFKKKLLKMKRYLDKIISKNHNIRIKVTNMPRTKGSKNRPKSDFESQITEKQSVIQTLTAEVEAIQKDIEEKKTNLKTKKSELKSAEKKVAKLEVKKAKAEQKAAEEAKKSEAEAVLKKLLAGGMSADEILERLK